MNGERMHQIYIFETHFLYENKECANCEYCKAYFELYVKLIRKKMKTTNI